jgi:hypothetical protein
MLVAQHSQTVRGSVVDQESKFPLLGVNVTIPMSDGSVIGSATDMDGNFRIENVPVGRQRIIFSYLGYQDFELPDIIVSSGKEVVLHIELEEKVNVLDEVIVTAKKSGEPINEMATVSAREFSVQETNRYAGSRGEPARMASNFAGVQGADDSRNDIIIRGNSPTGVLWRMEGINIPNPNHFSIPGTGGGSVTILNNKYLANSDFFTGAFPAEYGNGVAGVFDLKMRNGNNQKFEFSGQLGFLGTEFMAEGPISKSAGSSFLVGYRYSTLQLFQFLNINVGTDAIPRYQDGVFRLNFPRKNGGNIALFGIGGMSDIDILISDQEAPIDETLIYGSNDRDQYFGSNMGVVGASYTQPINKDNFIKFVVSASHAGIQATHDYVYRRVENNLYVVDSLPTLLDYTFNENKYSAYLNYVRKINQKASLKAGVNIDLYDLNFIDSARATMVVDTSVTLDQWAKRWDSKDMAALVQPYVHFKYKFSDKLKFTAGLTSLYFSINDISFSPIEPRMGLSYALSDTEKLGFGAGLHSQIQSPYIYYYAPTIINGENVPHNLDKIGLLKSIHLVGSYDKNLKGNMRLKTEVYFQHLYDLPVEAERSSFSLVNSGAGFSRFFPDTLATGGQGRNYGLEFTLEKFFSRHFYFLVTGSLFDAKYKGSDNIWRNTSFNGKYAFNGLAGAEWVIRKNQTFNVGGKVTFAGGRWYGEPDYEESSKQLEVIYLDETANSQQFRPYFRADLKVNYRINTSKLTHEIAIDFVNIFNIKNILTLTFAPDHENGPIVEEYQLGFFPVFYYKLDF